MKSSLLGLSLAFLALPGVVAPQEKHPQLGLALDVPPRYSPIPVQPTEPWIVLRYVGEKKRDAPRGAIVPELYVIRIDWQEDPVPPPKPLPITTFARYIEQRLKGWAIKQESAGEARDGWTCKEYKLELAKSLQPVRWACELRNSERTWVVLGSCAREEAEKHVRSWQRCVESLEFFAPSQPPEALKWTKFYARNPRFRNPELRIRIRSSLVEGWDAEDSENYLFVYSTKNESLINHLEKRLEAIRRAYLELFPPLAENTAVSTVRICKDQEEYLHYGGPPGTAGYWNSATEELVLFVFENTGGDWQSGKEGSRSVLLHEGFHQYIHYAVGELDPHSWFNEGYGDYFSGAEFDIHGNVSRIHVNPWRIQWIQHAIAESEHPTWSEIGWMEKKDYYGPKRSINYAMGWSMIYFLNQCKEVKKHPAWGRILPTYFETLKAASARERARLEAEGLAEQEEALEQANKTVREEAASAAFRDVDLFEIQDAWREFTLELKAPK